MPSVLVPSHLSRRSRSNGPSGLLGAATVLVLALSIPSQASAVDGVVEISHTCAVQTGCVAGDTPGYPITIDGRAGASYRLTSNLIVPDANTHGISISVPQLTIDLNGFEIVRAGCERAISGCTLIDGTGDGIHVTQPEVTGIVVKNGAITAMGENGVLLGHHAQVSGLRVRWCGARGASVGDGSTLSDSVFHGNGAGGLLIGGHSTLTRIVAYQNALVGIQGGTATVVTQSSAFDNASLGIAIGGSCTCTDNAVYGNGATGMSTGFGSVVRGNIARENGGTGISAGDSSTITENASYQNISHGISTTTGSTVARNTVYRNVGYGLSLGAGTGYRENVISTTNGQTVTGGLNMLSNVCDASATCP